MDKAISELLDKQAITEALYRYCRSMDRMDKDLLRTVFFPEATIQYMPDLIHRSTEEFMDWVWGHHEQFLIHSHQVTCTQIELNGDKAASEAYGQSKVVAARLPNGRLKLISTMGRYLDRWERRNGQWKIAHRLYCADIHAESEIPDAMPSAASLSRRDPRDPTKDPSYKFINVDSKAAE
jgi:hypothetical protein